MYFYNTKQRKRDEKCNIIDLEFLRRWIPQHDLGTHPMVAHTPQSHRTICDTPSLLLQAHIG